MEARRTPLNQLFADVGAGFINEEGVERPLHCGSVGSEYGALRESTALADGGNRSLVEVQGKDATNFLHRLLTSDVAALPNGGGQWSAMLTPKGKWVADLLVYRCGDSFFLDAPQGRTTALLDSLERMHFTEDVTWERLGVDRLLVLGPGAEPALRAEGVSLPASGVGGFAIALSAGLTLLARPDLGVEAWELVGEGELIARWFTALRKGGAVPCGAVALDIVRVEEGLPRFGVDYDESEILPLAGEWQRVSFEKGCYVGQEVVARVFNYGEAPYKLCRVAFDSDTPVARAELTAPDGANAGMVTSWTLSPREGRALGLASIRRAHAADSIRLLAAAAEDPVECTVLSVRDSVLQG